MTSYTQIPQDIRNPSTLQFGSTLDRPIDDLNDWPDLRYRDVTADELAALRLKIKQMYEVVKEFDRQLEREEADRRADPAWRERVDRVPYVPGSFISFIHITLKLAQRMLDERCGDEVSVAHLRLAEGLVRQLVTWRGTSGEGRVERLSSISGEEPVVAAASEGVYTPPRFSILEPVEHTT